MNKGITVKILSLLLSIALLLTCMPFAIAAEEKTFSIATVNDIHYFPESLAGNKREAFYTYLKAANCVYNDLDAILDAALESLAYEVENNGLKHIVLVGDLTTNGEYEGHEALAEKLLSFEEKTGASVYVTTGNHDINNPRASTFINDVKEEARTTSMTDFYEIYKDLGFNDAYHQFTDFTSERAGCLSYSVKTEDGYRLIIADGGKFTGDITDSGEDKQETAGAFTPELLEWILSEAEDAKKDGEIPLLFTHWNMSGMNYFHEFLMQGFVIDDGYKLQEILADAGINYSFGGHQHVSDVSITYSDSGNPMYSVITPTLTQFPFSYRVTDFKENSEGGLDVTFNQRECDRYAGVVTTAGDSTYPAPYRKTGFIKQFGGNSDAADYIFNILKNTLDKYFYGFRKEGSIVKYLEKELEIDIEETVNSYLFGGIYFEGTNILSGKNVMSFLNDLDRQIMEEFIYPQQQTYKLIKDTLRTLLDTEISDVPCTKYLNTYGFGDTEKGGTLGDAVLSVIATMYYGNEDISDDLFLQDIVEFSGKTEFLDLLISLVKEHIVDGLLVDTILAKIDFNIKSLFVDKTATIGEYVQMIYTLILSVLDSGILSVDSAEAFVKAFVKIESNFNDISLKRLIEAVLGTGLISYGSTIDELIDSLLEQFLPLGARETAVYQAKIVIGGMVQDDTKDHGVTYTNNGAVEVVPTKEDMQLPINVTMSVAQDNSSSFTVSWFTKYSVTGTDIEIAKEGEAFTGKALTEGVTATSEKQIYSAPGFDVGEFSILPYEREIIKHTVTVTGLEADTDYKFTIGDFTKGFTSEGKISTAPEDGGKFTFIHISGSEGYIPSHYENLTETLTAADSLYPDSDFIVHTGSLTKKPENDDQWSFAINAAEDIFRSKRFVYSAGETDMDGNYAVEKYFSVTTAPAQLSDSGVYYSYDYADAHFVVLNTNSLTSGGALSLEQAQWLREDLANSNKTWNILIMHQSIYGAAASETLKSQLLSIMEEYDIDLILQGSENIFVRTDFIRDNAPVLYNVKEVTVDGVTYDAYTDAKGTVAVISGSAGTEFGGETPEGVCYEETASYNCPMFSAVTIDGNVLAVSSYTVENGKADKVDSFAIEKNDTAIMLGDTDLDGKITAADARLALRYSVGLEELTAEQKVAANADLSDEISAADARLILRASVGLEEIYPEYVFCSKLDLDNIRL